MVASIVTTDYVDSLLPNPMTDLQRVRAQLDIDAVTETIENWLNRKLVETDIDDERHVGLSDMEAIRFKWRPVKEMVGIRWDTDTSPMYYDYNDFYDEQLIPRGQVYYVSYVVDASEVASYTNTLKRIISTVAINGVLKSDPVRYGVINSYNVEGLSISYNGGGSIPDQNGIGPISGTDLSSLSRLRQRVIV